MIIKEADDRNSDLELLKSLAGRPDATEDQRKRIQQEIRNIQAGAKGEAEAAYELGFHYGSSKNWMIIHDLRIECEGRVAQIDHLLINRFLEFWVCESKHFAEGIAINEHGECSAFYGGKAYGVPSPIEQNRKHIAVLASVFKSGLVKPPTRLGFTIKPTFESVILVSKRARISRPKTKLDGLDAIIKNDQIKSRIDKAIDSDINVLNAAKIVSSETIEEFARNLAAIHTPIAIDWHAKFGLSKTAPVAEKKPAPGPIQEPDVPLSPATEASPTTAAEKRSSKLACAACGTSVTYAVAKFCWFNKARFQGSVYCMDCQRTVF